MILPYEILHLKPDDVLVITVPGDAGLHEIESMQQLAKELFPTRGVIVRPETVGLTIVRPDDPEGQAAA